VFLDMGESFVSGLANELIRGQWMAFAVPDRGVLRVNSESWPMAFHGEAIGPARAVRRALVRAEEWSRP